MSTKGCETMDYQDEENKPEKMECEESLSAQQILMDVRRKLLRYQIKRWSTEQEEMTDSLMNYHDECPDCDALIIENFQCVDQKRNIFQCRNCISCFTPEIEKTNKRR